MEGIAPSPQGCRESSEATTQQLVEGTSGQKACMSDATYTQNSAPHVVRFRGGEKWLSEEGVSFRKGFERDVAF